METYAEMEKRRKKLNYPKYTRISVKKNGKTSHFIGPLGVTTAPGKEAYGKNRAKGMSKGHAAAIAHVVDKKVKAARKRKK